MSYGDAPHVLGEGRAPGDRDMRNFPGHHECVLEQLANLLQRLVLVQPWHVASIVQVQSTFCFLALHGTGDAVTTSDDAAHRFGITAEGIHAGIS